MAAVVKCLVVVYLLLNVCYCSSPVNEPLEAVMRVLNDCVHPYWFCVQHGYSMPQLGDLTGC